MAIIAERIYPRMPVWTQNIGISLFGLFWRRERIGQEFDTTVTDFARRERISAEEMEVYTTQRLQRLLSDAFDHVPYYRQKWQTAGMQKGDLRTITPQTLHLLPPTPKDDLRTDADAFISCSALEHAKLHRYTSSGSTGKPITAIYTRQAHQRFMAAREVRSFRWAGGSLLSSRAMIGGRMVVPQHAARPPYYRYNIFERQVYFSAFHIARETVRDYVEGFQRHKPLLLTGYAHAYYYLASLMLAEGITLNYSPTALIYSSEKLSRSERDVIEQAFRTRTYEEYGSVENCLLATECELGSLHQHPDFGIMEIIDSAGQPCVAGQEGKILATGFLNDAQCLIRYEIGDEGIWAKETCPCGRNHLPVIQEITGRIEDTLLTPDGRLINRFHGIWIGLPAIIEGQIIQESLTAFRILVVTARSLTPSEKQTLSDRLIARLGDVVVRIDQVAEIARTERGKFRAVICQLTLEEKGWAMGSTQRANDP